MADILGGQQQLGFVRSQFYEVEREVYTLEYPSFDYASFIPVVTGQNPWARGTYFFSIDRAGRADWINGNANDIPYADINRAQLSHAYSMAGIGYEWHLEEVELAQREGLNLDQAKAEAARAIAEEFLFNIAMTGDTAKNMTGLINDANVTAADVAADGTGSSTFWPDKTPALILRDINAALTAVWTGTGQTDTADTLLLPYNAYNHIASTPRSDNSDSTILDYLLRNNVYTAQTGRPLMVRALRTLQAADPGGDSRMVAYRRDPRVLRFHLPMPHRFLPPFQKSSMGWEVAGIMRTGGTEIRLPRSVRYSDAIWND